jgi:hypothetical protein
MVAMVSAWEIPTEQVIAGLMLSFTGWRLISFSKRSPGNGIFCGKPPDSKLQEGLCYTATARTKQETKSRLLNKAYCAF